MKSINFILMTTFMIIITNSSLYSQYPPINWLLTQKGYNFDENDIITCPNQLSGSTQGQNNDELGIVDDNPFLVKVKDYPPIRAFPMTYPSDNITFYYMAFDTDNENKHIPVRIENNVWNTIKTFRADGSGYEFNVFPPENGDVNNSADFLLDFNGTGKDKVWDEPGWDWNDILSTPIEKTNNFSVKLEGLFYLDLGTNGDYIANVEGGEGHYTFKWEKRIIYSDGSVGAWKNLGEKIPSTYSDFSGCFDNYTVYVYFNEYKINIQKNESNDIELKVTVTSYNFDGSVDVISAVKIITSNPPKIKLVNLIENTDNFGSLIVDDNISNPITSGNTVQLNYNSYHSLRTNLLPYVINWNNSGKNEKQIFWTYNRTISKKYFNLTKTIIIDENTPKSVEANFYKIEPVTIQTEIDGVPAGKIYFSDPWYYYQDSNGNWVQSDVFIEYDSPVTIDENSVYGGVFLGQGYDPVYDVWNPPYYSIKASSTITINNKTHKLYFDYWEASSNEADATFKNANLYSTAVVFYNAGATVNAVMKGNLLSNDAAAFANNNQRKIVRTADGTLHLVYESMGKIWYTLSSDNGANWSQEKLIAGFNGYIAKSPSLTADGNDLYITYWSPYIEGVSFPELKVDKYTNGNLQWSNTIYITTNINRQSFNPSVAIAEYFGIKIIAVIFKEIETSGFNMYYRDLSQSTWNSAQIPNTGVNCVNPSISSGYGESKFNTFHLVWQENISYSYKYIRYQKIIMTNPKITFSDYSTPSSGGGYTKNYNPTITVMDNNVVRVGWVGYRFVPGIKKTTDQEVLGTNIYQAVHRERTSSGWNGIFYKLGAQVSTVNVNRSDDNNSVFT